MAALYILPTYFHFRTEANIAVITKMVSDMDLAHSLKQDSLMIGISSGKYQILGFADFRMGS